MNLSCLGIRPLKISEIWEYSHQLFETQILIKCGLKSFSLDLPERLLASLYYLLKHFKTIPVMVKKRENIPFCEIRMPILHLFVTKALTASTISWTYLGQSSAQQRLNILIRHSCRRHCKRRFWDRRLQKNQLVAANRISWDQYPVELVANCWQSCCVKVPNISAAAFVTTALHWATNPRASILVWPIRSGDLWRAK